MQLMAGGIKRAETLGPQPAHPEGQTCPAVTFAMGDCLVEGAPTKLCRHAAMTAAGGINRVQRHDWYKCFTDPPPGTKVIFGRSLPGYLELDVPLASCPCALLPPLDHHLPLHSSYTVLVSEPGTSAHCCQRTPGGTLCPHRLQQLPEWKYKSCPQHGLVHRDWNAAINQAVNAL